MRAEQRREQLIDHLRAGLRPAPELARLLGVTERTIRRDVRLLQRRGVRIEQEQGPRGGYRLADDTRVLVELEPGHIRELVAALLFAAKKRALLTSTGVWDTKQLEALVERLLAPLPARRARSLRELGLSLGEDGWSVPIDVQFVRHEAVAPHRREVPMRSLWAARCSTQGPSGRRSR